MREPPTDPADSPGRSSGGRAAASTRSCCLAATLAEFISATGWPCPFVRAGLALALAVVFTPFQRWLEAKVRRPNLAAVISVVVVGLIVVVPVTLVGQRLIRKWEGRELFKEGRVRRVAACARSATAPRAARRLDGAPNLPASVEATAGWLTTTGAAFVKGSFVEMIGLLLTFYLLSFLRDGRPSG